MIFFVFLPNIPVFQHSIIPEERHFYNE